MTNKQIHIEKYDIDAFEKEQKPYAMILTDVIQRIPADRMKEAFLWIFLESLPPTWVPNKQHIMQHFDISAKTYDRWMSWLNTVKLIEYRQNRGTGGAFGKGTLIVLSGSRFSPEAESHGTVKIDGTVVNKKKGKVIHISEANRTPKNDCSVQPSTTRASTGKSKNPPNTQKTEVPPNDAHINTTKSFTKERKKTNNPVSVFSDTESVKNHIELVLANRQAFVEDDMIQQGIYYAYETNEDKSFDSVNKRINIFLKKVREGKWLIPQNYKGISSQSIREQEEAQQKEKQEQYRQEAVAMQNLTKTLSANPIRINPNIELFTPEESRGAVHVSEGLKGFSALLQQLKDDVDEEGTNKRAVPEKIV